MKTGIVAMALAMVVASGAFAGPGAEAVQEALAGQGYRNIQVEKTGQGLRMSGQKGQDIAVVILDEETEEVIAQGKFRKGERIGDEVIPAKHHKDDGVKYGDREHDRTAGNDDGERHHKDDGEAGCEHSHSKSQSRKD